MKKVVLLTLVSGVALPLLGDAKGIDALRRARTLTTANVTAAKSGFRQDLARLKEIKSIIDSKEVQQRQKVRQLYNQLVQQIAQLESTAAASALRRAPRPLVVGRQPKPTGPPPIPAGALNGYPPIQGPTSVQTPQQIPMAAPPAQTPIAPPPRVTPMVTGVKPAGPRASKPPAVTEERKAFLEQILQGTRLRPPSPSDPRKQETTFMKELLKRRRRSIAPEESEVGEEDNNEDWETN